MSKEVRVRFAPSPTGHLHIGNARTALFNWLFARHHGGKFVLRIEDTDMERSTAASEQTILDDLRWLGLDWDEGPGAGGDFGPYRQSERLDIYRRHAARLLESGAAYECFCPEQELEQQRQKAQEAGVPFQYDGRCRNLTDRERERLRAEGRVPAVRFAVEGGEVAFEDGVRGTITFDTANIGDFVIVRSDGIPPYNFVVTVDDHEMGITHVIRGEDHISNTPKQILLYRALGWEPPVFAHQSLTLGPDRTRLSKRHGATSVSAYREQGYLPEALVNYIALLGWSSPTGDEKLSRERLVAEFDLDRVSKASAVFDFEKLNWLSGLYLREADPARLTGLARPFIEHAGFSTQDADGAWLESAVDAVRGNLDKLSDIGGYIDLFFDVPIEPDPEALKILAWEGVPGLLEALGREVEAAAEFTPEKYKEVMLRLMEQTGRRGKKLFMPARVAVTGRSRGPELEKVFALIPREVKLSRIGRALDAARSL